MKGDGHLLPVAKEPGAAEIISLANTETGKSCAISESMTTQTSASPSASPTMIVGSLKATVTTVCVHVCMFVCVHMSVFSYA